MVVSRGGITGGLTITDALREFERRGYIGQFAIRDEGKVECVNCGTVHRPPDVPVEGMRRVEGVSDPADMLYIGALQCPDCGQRGTAVIKYGTTAPEGDAAFLRELESHRPSTQLTREATGDHSLVRDTGWLKGPEE